MQTFYYCSSPMLNCLKSFPKLVNGSLVTSILVNSMISMSFTMQFSLLTKTSTVSVARLSVHLQTII